MKKTWVAGSFLDNFAASADAVGLNNLDLAWGLARVRWESTDQREEFLQLLTAIPSREVING